MVLRVLKRLCSMISTNLVAALERGTVFKSTYLYSLAEYPYLKIIRIEVLDGDNPLKTLL